jgi:acyl-CoA reductase-like NAD-dependent aldehyde dehydrogenase
MTTRVDRTYGRGMDYTSPMWIAGKPVQGRDVLEVHCPFDGAAAGSTTYATAEQVEAAVTSAATAAAEAAALPAHVRADALLEIAGCLSSRADEIAELITAESGKPMIWSRAEVVRAVSVFRWAGEHARQWSGQMMRLDTDPGGEGRLGYVRRVPKGPVLAISPFNFPLNLAAHKVAPAIAVGAPVVLKPAPKTPLSGLLLGELVAGTQLPAGMVNVINVPDRRASELVADVRLPVVSFTGSGPVGHAIQHAVPSKHVTLELGGNAAVVVCADFADDDDLAAAAQRIATFANYQAGQSCIGVQRVYVDASLYSRVRDRVVAAVEALVTGDPRDPLTQVGPMINEEAAARVEQWIAAAVSAGASVCTRGGRGGTTVQPTVLENVPEDADVVHEEIFGPVVVLSPFDGVEVAFDRVNASRYGLQAGVFTRDIRTAFRAHVALEVGGVVIGDVPSYRADQMPYGGAKASGVGREGVRSAMEDFTYERTLVLSGIDL